MSAAQTAIDLSRVLDGIVGRHGVVVLDNRRRLLGLLRDYAPAALRDIRVLMTAFDAGVPARLRALPGTPAPDVLAREADSLGDRFGCRDDLARTAVEAWARVTCGVPDGGIGRPAPLPLPIGAGPSGIRSLPTHAPARVGRWARLAARWAASVAGILVLGGRLLRALKLP